MDGVTLDRLRAADAPAMVRALTDPETTRWLSGLPVPYGLAEAQAFIAGAGPEVHAIRVKGDFAGTVRASDTLGYWVAPGFRRRGVARRAAVLALTRSFAGGRAQVSASVAQGHAASAALLAQLGFSAPESDRLFLSRQGREGPAIRLTLRQQDFAARHGIALQTGRLVMDVVRPEDLPALHAIATAPEVARMLFLFAPGMAMRDFAAIFPLQSLLPPFRLAIRHQGAVIGSVGIGALDEPGGPPIYYFLSPQSWGQGFGREVLDHFLPEIDARFDPPLLQAGVFADNPASARMLERAGFARQGAALFWSAGRGAEAEGWTFLRRRG